MLSITKVNNSIKVEGLDNKQFPDNGTLMIPLNSVILTLDDSNIATFRSAANNDVLFSGVITDIQISGTPMTKQTITTAFTSVANSSGGGGGTVDAYTKAETDALLATKANESELSDYATVESLATVATSGSYDDLSNKPTIPVVPTNVSAFTNDAGYLTQHQDISGLATKTELSDHTGNTTIHVTALDKTNWNAKAELSDIPDVTGYINGAVYDSQTKRINFKHGDTVVAYIDATPFVVDGMVDTVEITGGNLVITWNTDAGKQSTSIPLTDIFNPDNYYNKTDTDTLLAAKANSADLATVATSGDYDDLTNKPTIPTVPTNVSAFTNDAGYTTNEGTITGITMNGVSKGTSGVVDLGTVVTDISGKQDVIDSSHKLDADLVDDTTSANKFVTASDKSTWSGKQDALVSGTNIKTINNESILGSGNITIQGGGSSYTAGDNIDITNDVISVDIDNEKKVIASALTELHNDKADKSQLNNYQLKGDYQTGAQVDTKIATATSTLRTEAEAINVEKVDAAALNDLNARVSDLEQGGGGTQVQSDWNQTDTTAVDYIKNKPDVVNVVTTSISGANHDLLIKQNNGNYETVYKFASINGVSVAGHSSESNPAFSLQEALVSGTNIKTINGNSILGEGNLVIEGGSGGGGITGITMNGSPVTVTSGVADLGTVITEHQSLANYYTKSEIDAMIGNISSSLDTINGEVI